MQKKTESKVSYKLGMFSCSNHAVFYWLNLAFFIAIALGMRSLESSAQNTVPTQATNAAANVDFGPYMAGLQRRIKRAWFPPKGEESRRVSVVFKVGHEGELSNLRLQRSSGNALADSSALKAVENAAPFRHLPEGSPESVDIQFTFDYNVFNQGRHNPVPPLVAANNQWNARKFEQNCHSADWLLYAFGGAVLALFAAADH